MSLKKWGKVLGKKEFVDLVHTVVNRVISEFDYTLKPYVFETELGADALMAFYCNGKYTSIGYDYAKFKRRVGSYDYDVQYTYVVQCVSHEMRHYYQHRQLIAKTPRESKKTIDDWRKNKIIKPKDAKKEINGSYWFSARELDANLFGYIYVLRNLKRADLNSIISKSHFNALKKLYKQYGGKFTRKYFSKKIEMAISE